jgi:hypothetical protein
VATPRPPKGPPPREQLAQRQKDKIERLYRRAEAARRDRQWLDRVIYICRTTGGGSAVQKNAIRHVRAHQTFLEKTAEYADDLHRSLHEHLDPTETKCNPRARDACVSVNDTLQTHFRFWLALNAALVTARDRVAALGKEPPEFFKGVPLAARTKGGAVAYLHEKFGFTHADIALLCAAYDEPLVLPIEKDLLDRTATNLRKAYSSLPKTRQRFVKLLIPTSSQPHTGGVGRSRVFRLPRRGRT